jgi:hypothetical protein
VYLKDNYVEPPPPLINVTGMRLIAEQVHSLLEYQTVPYKYQEVPPLLEYFSTGNKY